MVCHQHAGVDRTGKAHPVLAAEVAALTGRPFEIWRLDKLVGEVRAYVGQ